MPTERIREKGATLRVGDFFSSSKKNWTMRPGVQRKGKGGERKGKGLSVAG